MALAEHLLKIPISVLILACILSQCNGNDMLGCGGFVKSHVALDYSKIEIGLYTKSGSLKERTECAPTNGYYFLPLYEKGEYVLKVHPPPGWSFEPSEVHLVVDGTSDHCSTNQDINFSFNGFGITGRVITAGQALGPSGIAVQLINDKGDKRDTVTTTGGDFHFTPVIPGKYTLKASHPRWKLEPAQAVVQVKEGNTALPVGVLAVKGYDVKGSITSYGNPISGIYVLLYSKEENPKYRIEGCNTALLQGVPDAPICHSVTDASGEFTFGLVPAGQYKLMVLSQPPGQASIRYNIKPDSVPFSVAHDSLYIKNAFEVTGFTVVGSVVSSVGGGGISGARVLVDGNAAATTDAAGKFILPNLQPATYTLAFQHDQCQFDDVQLLVKSSGPTGPLSGRASRWRVCGSVTPPPATRRTVVIATDRGDRVASIEVTDHGNGKWCTYLPPGVYNAKVEVSDAEQREGLQFYPLTQKISVGHGPVEGVVFSQLKARVSGNVVCKVPAGCEGLTVSLRPLSPDGGFVGNTLTTRVKNGSYTFTDVLPGSVSVWVEGAGRCWAESTHNVALSTDTARVPDFIHTGYVIKIHATHDIQVEYISKSSKGVFKVPAGDSQHCVESAEQYTLTPRGPHQFQPTQAVADPTKNNLNSVQFLAVAHAVVIKVLSPEAVNDLVLKITSAGSTRDVGPLVPLNQPSGGYAFEHTLFMAENEICLVSAHSSSLLFVPGDPQQVIGRDKEQMDGLIIRAVPGLTLAGKLVPPVDDVVITLSSGDFKVTQTTTSDGKYSFGPLDASKDYTITAEKESYVFGERADNGDIVAHKLAEITVELVDDADNTPLVGALVSVSGGSYRRVLVASSNTPLRFAALHPTQYYVKPNMKEYKFTPPHTILHVEEGKAHHVKLRGVRVAWSCIGHVVSLGSGPGSGWPAVPLSATPVPNSQNHCVVEEATTEANGAFRIRGLLPNCVYTLQLKEQSGPESLGLKLAKAPLTLEVKNNKDIDNVRLIAIQPHQITDANVLVYTPNVEHYKSLRLTLALESTPHTPVYSTRLDSAGYNQYLNPGLMYVLPRLPADNKTYILQLESSLSKATHSYSEEVHYFNSDGKFKSFNIEFLPKLKSTEQELRQTSVLVVPLVGLFVLAYLYRERVFIAVTTWVTTQYRANVNVTRNVNASRTQPALDRAAVDQIVSALNPTKKPTKKKAQ